MLRWLANEFLDKMGASLTFIDKLLNPGCPYCDERSVTQGVATAEDKRCDNAAA